MGASKVSSERPLLKRLAAGMRKEATPAEAIVWEWLRGRRFQGLKFRRQHVLEGHIVDFYCHEVRLCLELDGAPHLDPEQAAKDAQRDAHLRLKGYRVLRFMNEDVLKQKATFRRALQATCLPSQTNPPL